MDICQAFKISKCTVKDRFLSAVALATFIIYLHVYITKYWVKPFALEQPDRFSRHAS